MNESDRKLLTEYLGEKWEPHKVTEWPYYTKDGGKEYSAFPVDGSEPEVRFVAEKHRTFTTIQDFYDLMCKMAGNGEWEEFIAFYYLKWPGLDGDSIYGHPKFIAWIIRPESCGLVAEYLKGEKG